MLHVIPQGPWEKIGIDFFELQSHQYLLIVYYSRFPVSRRASNFTAAATVNIIKEVFSEYRIMRIVIIDNGPQFASKEFQEFSEKYCFIHKTSSPRYPKSNGLVERMVEAMRKTMRNCKAVKEDPYMAMLIYTTTPLTNSISAAAALLNGRKY